LNDVARPSDREAVRFGHAADRRHRSERERMRAQPQEIKELGDRLVRIAKSADKAVPVEWSARPASI
jgi:hypothetical protein